MTYSRESLRTYSRESLDAGTPGTRERPLRAVILVAAHRMGLRRRMRGWRRPTGAGGGGNVGVGVGGGPGGCCGGGGLDGGDLGDGGGGEGGCGASGGGGGRGGNCRRPGLVWKGALCWMSGRSCWSCALRGAPRPLLSRAAPSAGSVASLRTALSCPGLDFSICTRAPAAHSSR